jgi:hypothetical protein
VALNVGQDFKKRWLNTPETVRQTYQEDLARICDLLLPQTQIQTWIQLEEKAQLRSQQRIDQAYAHLKAELIEQARVRKQLALEKALEEKRTAEAAYAAQLQADELNQFEQQTENLVALRHHIDQEIAQQTERYQANPEQPSIDYAQGQRVQIDDQQIRSELESVRVRLELEAESLIEQAVTVFRAKLHALARSLYFEVTAPVELAKYLAEKGSVTVDGISLTINHLRGNILSLNLIPHTAERTNIGTWQVGTKVNLEVDVLARYIERLLLGDKAAEQKTESNISMAFLAENGFLK